jgi:hypothetical protein
MGGHVRALHRLIVGLERHVVEVSRIVVGGGHFGLELAGEVEP